MMGNPFAVEILNEIKHDLWLERKETWQNDNEPPMEMNSGYNHSDEYIGNAEDARYLCEERGIKPELANPDNNVCSIGYSVKEGKWFGWSHRAISGFDTKEQAIEFANEVS